MSENRPATYRKTICDDKGEDTTAGRILLPRKTGGACARPGLQNPDVGNSGAQMLFHVVFQQRHKVEIVPPWSATR